MFDKLVDLEVKYAKLQEDLADPEVLKNVSNIAKISKEIKDLQPIIEKFNEYKANKQDIEESQELLEVEDDAEMQAELKEIITLAEANIEQIEADLKVLMLPKDPNDGKNAILEIRGAAGGDEANIFAYDLYRMYTKYAETQGWKTELLESQDSPGGGFSNVSVLLKGEDVFSKMKFESGAHRVQRVPTTESQGRVHTSTATVVVMPEIEDVDVDIKDADLKIDTYRSSGAGGQSVNTTDSAVRITHLPTNIVVTSQDERSQISNKEKAMKVIRAKIYDHFLQIQMEENDSMRKNKLGTGSRSEKIRTYNYPQNRVTDHRIGLTLNKLDVIIDGKLDEVIEALVLEDQMERMKAVE
ncbi:peptide chain release factor 1 [Mollicutes bacterium LVI A0078]|nr:peptide chain release factor 1 [Mollicutes bacterium LVI A0075]WOO91621.1 peptide chain release factor 1 [Mollicutes bacterium LVI A0078]